MSYHYQDDIIFEQIVMLLYPTIEHREWFYEKYQNDPIMHALARQLIQLIETNHQLERENRHLIGKEERDRMDIQRKIALLNGGC